MNTANPQVAAADTKVMPVFSIRPRFDQPLAIIHALLAMVVGTIVLTVVGGTLLYMLCLIIGLGNIIGAGHIYGLVLVTSLVGVGPVFFELRKKAYQRTVWHFYDTHVDYQSFNFYVERRRGRLRYKDIQDIAQQASALQEQRGLTTVYLFAPSMRYQRRSSFAGVRVFDVPLDADYTTRIMDLVEGNQGPASMELAPDSDGSIARAARKIGDAASDVMIDASGILPPS